MLNGTILGTELDIEDQFEITALNLPDLEEDEETEIIEADSSHPPTGTSFRFPFMSFLFRNL